MNIKEAKQEIKNAIAAYLEKDSFGNYRIPTVRQRPLLLMGAPGIGKTAIMEQVARECGIGLVAYTITHHTRQSAIGLPFIQEKKFGGKVYSVTEYTMSEIIAAVYTKIEETGLQEGILFIDEINCVSETLAPAMLQFLQGKTFGNHKVPEGYIIVAAGNPPEYNKSVKEFDVVTLDRLKKIDVSAAYAPWKEYAYEQGIHGAILTYLDIKTENFYACETTIDGKAFVTARGWEDLSEMLYAYERQSIDVKETLVLQYLQHQRIAKDFANYLELYKKYQTDYHIEEIINGHVTASTFARLQKAPFDERLSVIGLLLSRLSKAFLQALQTEKIVVSLHQSLLDLKNTLLVSSQPSQEMALYLDMRRQQYQRTKVAGQSSPREEEAALQVIAKLEEYEKAIKQQSITEGKEAFEKIKGWFAAEVDAMEQQKANTSQYLEAAFDFMEEAFGESQEMVIWITELTMNPISAEFIKENPCQRYFQYNQELLFSQKQRQLFNEIQGAKGLMELL